jgi:archaellum component FlaD/FlaE
MQIQRCYRAICVAAFALAALTVRADDISTQAPPPTATSSQTITNKAELKKQAEAEAKAKKEAEKKAKAEAKAKKKAEAEARKEAEAKAKAQKGKPTQSTTNAPAMKKPAVITRPEAPPLPISSDKEQRLQELLKKYKADQLTPEQYQAERAKILAEP